MYLQKCSRRIAGLSIALIFLTSCSIAQPSPAPTVLPTDVPIPTATPVPPTPEPTLTPTPAFIAGIDEPLVVESVTVRDMFGSTSMADIKLLVLDAMAEESLEGGDAGPIYPDDLSDKFLTLLLEIEGPSGSVDWLGLNAALVCGTETYQANRTGLRVGEGGILEGWLLIYIVAGDSDFGQCALQLSEGQTVPLASFFD